MRRHPPWVQLCVAALTGYVLGLLVSPDVGEIALRHGWPLTLVIAVPPLSVAAVVGLIEGLKVEK